jgi:hypothetical protein
MLDRAYYGEPRRSGIAPSETVAPRHTFADWKRRLASESYVELVVVKPPYAVVLVTVKNEHGSDAEYGFAKCSPRDTFDHDRGVQIAKGRAIADLARRMMSR